MTHRLAAAVVVAAVATIGAAAAAGPRQVGVAAPSPVSAPGVSSSTNPEAAPASAPRLGTLVAPGGIVPTSPGTVSLTTLPAPPAPSFDEFLAGIRVDARLRGVSERTLDRALTDLQPNPVVVARDRAQPEFTESLDEYLRLRLTKTVIATGRERMRDDRALLARVEKAYGVPPNVMVAIWGLESNYGRLTGTYPTVQALATLAYDARRPIFRAELLAALAILDRGQVAPEDMKGSWAGAMGQPQFMPSSFLTHAVDFDHDGRIDIWSSPADVLGSMANFLRAEGWTAGERWGREVRISAKVMARIDRTVPMRAAGCRAVRELTLPRSLADWKALGVKLPMRTAPRSVQASLVRGEHRTFLVYRNYETLLQYNCSNAYAIAVGVLADKIE